MGLCFIIHFHMLNPGNLFNEDVWLQDTSTLFKEQMIATAINEIQYLWNG